MIRFPLTLRLDSSDSHVFDRAAEPDEWAIPGAFVFSSLDADAMQTGKMGRAFVSGFLGLASFGWSTLVKVAEMPDDEYETLNNSLAMHFVARYGAPDVASALPIARQELEFAASLCDHPLETIITVERILDDGGIKERFRTISPDTSPLVP